jgi:hypothetical protein
MPLFISTYAIDQHIYHFLSISFIVCRNWLNIYVLSINAVGFTGEIALSVFFVDM